MRKIKISFLLLITLASFQGFSQSKKQLIQQLVQKQKTIDSLKSLTIPKQNLTSRKDTFSYALGVDFYQNQLLRSGLDTLLNIDGFYLGLKNSEMGTDSFPDYLRDAVIQEVFQEVEARKRGEQEAQRAEMEMIARANSMKGEAYRKQNGQNPDVKTLENGLQYKVLKNGDLSGAMPSINSTVSVYYEGKLVDGKVFDGNVGSGNPISFPLNGVIKGWTEILQKMHKGDVWEVTIPAELAYGQNGAGGSIGPNETLIFMIELVDFK